MLTYVKGRVHFHFAEPPGVQRVPVVHRFDSPNEFQRHFQTDIFLFVLDEAEKLFVMQIIPKRGIRTQKYK